MISEEEEALAWRLRQYREWAGMKQSEAAKVLGLDATAITKIEHGERGVSAMELLALAKAYHVSVSTLLGEEMQEEQNFYQRELTALAHFSVNGSGVIFLKFSNPDFVMEVHPGDKYHEAFLHWCQARKRRNESSVDIDLPAIHDGGDW